MADDKNAPVQEVADDTPTPEDQANDSMVAKSVSMEAIMARQDRIEKALETLAKATGLLAKRSEVPKDSTSAPDAKLWEDEESDHHSEVAATKDTPTPFGVKDGVSKQNRAAGPLVAPSMDEIRKMLKEEATKLVEASMPKPKGFIGKSGESVDVFTFMDQKLSEERELRGMASPTHQDGGLFYKSLSDSLQDGVL